MHDRIEKWLEEVSYAPNFKGEKGILKVMRGSIFAMKGMRKNDLYVLEGALISSSILIIE